MVKEKISSYIQLYLNDVELNIIVTDKLTKREDALKCSGHITVSTGMRDSEDCFWDNLSFFIACDFKKFKEECKEDLSKAGFKCKPIYKDIKRLLKRAEKLNII